MIKHKGDPVNKYPINKENKNIKEKNALIFVFCEYARITKIFRIILKYVL